MKAVIVGATGMIGNYLLQELLNDQYFNEVIALTRKPLQIDHKKFSNIVVDFDNYTDLQNSFEGEAVVFATIGTTQKQVGGDKTAYRKIDFDIPFNMAKIGSQKGVKTFVIVSSVGADPDAGNFYTKLKGEVEAAVSSVGIKSVYIMRPSLLLGERKEFRITEKIFQALMPPLLKLTFGSMRKFRAIHGKHVASAMVKACKEHRPGKHILHYDDIMKMVDQ